MTAARSGRWLRRSRPRDSRSCSSLHCFPHRSQIRYWAGPALAPPTPPTPPERSALLARSRRAGCATVPGEAPARVDQPGRRLPSTRPPMAGRRACRELSRRLRARRRGPTSRRGASRAPGRAAGDRDPKADQPRRRRQRPAPPPTRHAARRGRRQRADRDDRRHRHRPPSAATSPSDPTANPAATTPMSGCRWPTSGPQTGWSTPRRQPIRRR